ncbi:unnamed protein product [Mucor hiemalis]
MSVQENFNCDEQQLFSPKDKWKNLSSSSLGKFRTEQLQESELRAKGTSLPSTIVQELDHYSETDNLPKAIQKYKKEVPHFLSTKRVTAETANPNFIDKLKEHKLDSLQHVNTNYKLTEATRVQAREATEIFSKLEFLNRRSLESRDETVIKNAVELLESLQSTDLALPNFKNQKQEKQLFNQVEIRSTPLEKISRVNQKTIEEVTPNDTIPMNIEDEEDTATTTTDLAVFLDEAEERSLNNQHQIASITNPPTTTPARTTNRLVAGLNLFDAEGSSTNLPSAVGSMDLASSIRSK